MAEKSETLVTKEDKLAEAKELFGRGSRNYYMKQYADAADDLSACCTIYSELHGPTAEECGVPYLLYAKSLTALGKDENNLIVPGEDEEEEEEDDGEEGEEGGDEEGEDAGEGDAGDEKASDDKGESEEKEKSAEDKSPATAESEKEKSAEDKSPATAESGKEATEAGPSSSKAESEPQPGPSTSGTVDETAETEDGEEEKGGGNLEVAWEILELAVKIFEPQGEKSLENLSECYSELAGISFENSHFPEAISDYNKSLSVYQKTGKSDSRLTAEIHYKVGLCHLMVNEFEDSIKSFRAACGELDKVIEQEKAKEQTDETKATIKDLEETKQEIVEKITEVEETKKTSIEEVKRELSKIIVPGETTNGFDSGAGPSGASTTNGTSSSSSSKAADKPTDISHLIKRKKPDTSSTEVEGSPAKKTAVESEAKNGD